MLTKWSARLRSKPSHVVATTQYSDWYEWYGKGSKRNSDASNGIGTMEFERSCLSTLTVTSGMVLIGLPYAHG